MSDGSGIGDDKRPDDDLGVSGAWLLTSSDNHESAACAAAVANGRSVRSEHAIAIARGVSPEADAPSEASTPRRVHDELAARHPDMPPAAENLFTKARIRAWAFEHHVNLVSVVAGKLVVDPVDIPADTMRTLRRARASWTPEKRKLRLPLKYFAASDDSELLEGILAFLQGLAE